MSVAGVALKAGRALGRSPDDVQPFIDLLRENWYDTVDSLRGVDVPDLVQLGLPQRFVKELMIAMGEGGGSYDDIGGKKGKDKGKGKSKHSDRDDYHDTGKGKSKGKGKGKEDGKAKGKDDGKGRGKDEGKGKKGKGKKGEDGGCFICGRDGHYARECPDNDDPGKGEDKGKGKGKGKGHKDTKDYKHMHKIMLEIDDIDPGFRFKSKVVGNKARNVKHIRDSTGAWVWLCGKGSHHIEADGQEADEPLHVLVKSDERDMLDEAVKITNDLIDTVFEQYEEWLSGDREDEPEENVMQLEGCFICGSEDHFAKGCPEKGERKGKGKSKGKGKEEGKGKGKGKKEGKGKGKKEGKKGKGKKGGKRKAERDEGEGGDDDFEEGDEPPHKRARTDEQEEDFADEGAEAGEGED